MYNKILSILEINTHVMSSEEEELYRYGLGILLDNTVLLIVILTTGLLAGRLPQTLIFIMVFVGMRQYTGGYHADKSWKCFILTNLLHIAVLILTHISINYDVIILGSICCLYSISMIWAAAPIIGINNIKTDDQVKKDKKTCRVLACLGSTFSLTGLYFSGDFKALFVTAIVTMAEVALLINLSYIKEKIKNEKGNKITS